MQSNRHGQIAVIFQSQRNARDDEGYRQAADLMEALAATQPGYCGISSVRDASGLGITISYWIDEAAAGAWRDHPEHVAIRERGRGVWYDSYSIDVTNVIRNYDWTRRG